MQTEQYHSKAPEAWRKKKNTFCNKYFAVWIHFDYITLFAHVDIIIPFWNSCKIVWKVKLSETFFLAQMWIYTLL